MTNLKTIGGKKIYTTVQGDMWDLIAYKLWQNEYHMDELIRANPDYTDVHIFSAGIKLTVPEIPVKQTVGLPPWKRKK